MASESGTNQFQMELHNMCFSWWEKLSYWSGILLIDVIISSFWQCFEGSSIYGTESYKRKIYNISPRSVGKKTKCIEAQQSFKTKKENSS